MAKTAVGPFHGMISPTTPIGSRTCATLYSLGTAGMEPCSFEGHPLKYSMPSTANWTMNPVYMRSRPASSTSISPNSSPRSATRAAMLRSTFSFAIGGWLRQRPSSNAARAERAARSTSSPVPAAALAMTSPVAGSTMSRVAPSLAPTQLPSITWPKTSRLDGGAGCRGHPVVDDGHGGDPILARWEEGPIPRTCPMSLRRAD